MNHNLAMRNIFWDKVYSFAKKDKNVMIVSADMGAPALDKFRKELPKQYLNVGIAEHSMLATAAGLAREGKEVYTYAIAPFATSRCHEFTKLNCGLMKLPIKIVGVGAGFGYEDSGPTHHTTEDISIMRAIPNLEIYSPADCTSAAAFADLTYRSGKPAYLRLDRQILPEVHNEGEDFRAGFKIAREGMGGGTSIVTTGNLVHKALDISDKMQEEKRVIGVIELYRIKPLSERFAEEAIRPYGRIVSWEEHLLDGGLGSIIAETIADKDIPVKLRRIGLKDYVYAYGGRDNIQKVCGIDSETVERVIRQG